MPEELVPPVVAVVVTKEPGEWLETCLVSLRDQEYPNLAMLVIDDGSTTDVTPRVAAVDPSAVVRRREEPAGYASCANEALVGIDGAMFFLVCHDDVELEEGALRQLVAESFRQNAGVIGPKLVQARDPHRLSDVGLGMNSLGAVVSRVEPGELDQSQHDEARAVFAVPGACMLVRADLFGALEGFDPEMAGDGEDLDLCWRAQVAGARVAVAPQAVVRHVDRESVGAGAGTEPVLLRHRHQLRSVMKNYGLVRRAWATVQLGLAGLAAVLVAIAAGRRDDARRELRAWTWNLARRRSLAEARHHLREIRQVPDRSLVRRMAPRFRSKRSGDLPLQVPERVGDGARPGRRLSASSATILAVLVVLGVIGLRNVLFSPLPIVGQLVSMHPATTLLARYLGGLPSAGAVRPGPPAFALVGTLGVVLLNSSATAWKVIELGSLVLGAVGAARMTRPWTSKRAPAVAAIVFFVLAFGWNAVATGNVEAAVSIGAAPFILARLARAGGLMPGAGRAGLVGEIAPLGLLVAVAVALAPPVILAIGAMALATAAASLLGGDVRSALRVLAVAGGALVVAFVCCLPWSASFLEHGALFSAITGAVPGAPITPASLLRGHTGPIGAWWGTWGVFAASSYALFVTRGARQRCAVAWWLGALFCAAVAWAGSEGWLGSGAGASAVIAGPVAACIAGLCALGVVGFERDVTREVIGWRHGAAVAAGACLVVGAVPVVATLFGGHAELPSAGFESTLTWPQAHPDRPYGVLWLGDPRALPAAGWQLQPGLAWYVATDGFPSGADLWPPSTTGALKGVARAIEAAESGSTADVGVLLARSDVRFVVVPLADAPRLPGTQVPAVSVPAPARLVGALREQGDLVEQPVEAGALVFENADWTESSARHGIGGAAAAPAPGRAVPGSSSPSLRGLGLAAAAAAVVLCVAEGFVRRRRSPGPDGPEADAAPPDEADRDDGVVETLWDPEEARL